MATIASSGNCGRTPGKRLFPTLSLSGTVRRVDPRVHPQAHRYTIVAFHPRVFQGYRIYFIPWEDHVERT
uniref:Uncharacterized protein n=1 Tax=Oryza sativa subsp. japonica TaxID=39947 RepID=Q339H8_ORYSJ|nr:hypothetical protein LOC_Os10g21160 [Oryza sativa Japonica Group]